MISLFGVAIRTGRIRPVELTGCFLPCRQGKPLVKRFPRHDCLYVLAFRSRELLENTLGRETPPLFDRVLPIEDGLDFLSQVPSELKVMLDLEFLSDDCIQWLEIQPPTRESQWPPAS